MKGHLRDTAAPPPVATAAPRRGTSGSEAKSSWKLPCGTLNNLRPRRCSRARLRELPRSPAVRGGTTALRAGRSAGGAAGEAGQSSLRPGRCRLRLVPSGGVASRALPVRRPGLCGDPGWAQEAAGSPQPPGKVGSGVSLPLVSVARLARTAGLGRCLDTHSCVRW